MTKNTSNWSAKKLTVKGDGWFGGKKYHQKKKDFYSEYMGTKLSK